MIKLPDYSGCGKAGAGNRTGFFNAQNKGVIPAKAGTHSQSISPQLLDRGAAVQQRKLVQTGIAKGTTRLRNAVALLRRAGWVPATSAGMTFVGDVETSPVMSGLDPGIQKLLGGFVLGCARIIPDSEKSM